MTDDKLIDLWNEAQKQATISNPRAFEDLKVFAELVEKQQDKPPMEPEDIIFVGFMIAVLIFGMAYAMFNFQPVKAVPDCGKCKVYKEGKQK